MFYKGLKGTLKFANCTALRTLNCGGNQLTSLNVSGCTNLRILNCYDNQLTSLNLDGTGFANYTTVERLELGNYRLYVYTYLDGTKCTLYADTKMQIVFDMPTTVGAPTNFKAVQSGKNMVLTWSAAENATTYRIGRWNDVTKKWVDLSKACMKLTLTNNNVSPGTHKYLLRAYNGISYGNSVTVSINVKGTAALSPLEAVFAEYEIV